MAKKKRAKPGPKPSERGPRDAMLGIKCYRPWLAWAHDFAESERIGLADMIDQLLAAHAKVKGFKSPPKR